MKGDMREIWRNGGVYGGERRREERERSEERWVGKEKRYEWERVRKRGVMRRRGVKEREHNIR